MVRDISHARDECADEEADLIESIEGLKLSSLSGNSTPQDLLKRREQLSNVLGKCTSEESIADIMQQIDRIPDEWTIVGIQTSPDQNHVIVSRIQVESRE